MLLFSSLVVGAVLSFAFFGEFGLLIFLLMWFDKIPLSFINVVFPLGKFGVEFATLPCVLVAMLVKEPTTAFMFAFLIRSVIVGLFDLIKWLFIPPSEATWFPLIPSKDDFLRGVSNYMACIVWNLTNNFVLTLTLASAIYGCLNAFFDKMMSEDQRIRPERFLNVIFNLLLALFFGDEILSLFGFV